MPYSTIDKFLKTFNLKVSTKISKMYKNHRGHLCVCILLAVTDKKNNIEYATNRCYRLERNMTVFEQSNDLVYIDSGKLTYLGDEDKIESYFDNIAAGKAVEYFHEKQST